MTPLPRAASARRDSRVGARWRLLTPHPVPPALRPPPRPRATRQRRPHRFAAAPWAILILAMLPAWPAPEAAAAPSQAELETIVEQLHTRRKVIQRRTLALLVIYKNLGELDDRSDGDAATAARGAAPTAAGARAADVAGHGGTPADTLLAPLPRSKLQSLGLAVDLRRQIDTEHAAATKLVERCETTYRRLDPAARSTAAPVHQRFTTERDKIQQYTDYVERYSAPYEPLLAAVAAQRPAPAGGGRRAARERAGGTAAIDAFPPELQAPPPGTPPAAGWDLSGNLSLLVGRTSFNDGNNQATQTSREIAVRAAKTLSPRSRLRAALTHRGELTFTAYNVTDLRVEHDLRAASGKRLRSFLSYQAYNDSIDQNDFGHLALGGEYRQPLGRSSQTYANLRFNNRSYKAAGGNEFTGAQYDAGLRVDRGAGKQLALLLQGTSQTSDVPSLKFNRIMPVVEYRSPRPAGSFKARLELESLGFSSTAELSNFTRERLVLNWTGGGERELFVTGKQFPNNNLVSYVKAGGKLRAQSYAGTGSSSHSFSGLITLFPSGGNDQVTYGDLRYDFNRDRLRQYVVFSTFARVWGPTDTSVVRDHVVTFYGTYGWKLARRPLGRSGTLDLRLGPLFGGRLLYDPDQDFPKREGNSLRAGVDFGGNARIGPATLDGKLRYERSFVYGREIAIDNSTGVITKGDLVLRQPTTWEFALALKAPFRPDLDYRFDIDYYKVANDVDDTTSISPVDKQSKFKLLTGIRYRFRL